MAWQDAQKAVLPLFLLPCILLLFFMYRFGRRSLRGSETFTARMDYLYTFAAASIMGEFLFQAFPNSSLSSIGVAPIFIMVGLFSMMCLQKYSRVWNDSPNYSGSGLSIMEIHNVIDPETFEILEVFQADGLDNEHIGEQRMALEDEHAELRKRAQFVIITLGMAGVLCILEGFFLVYEDGNKWLILVAFWLDKLMETTVLSTSMLHGYYHAKSSQTRNWFVLGSAYWIVVMIISCLPVFLDMTKAQATMVVTHLATNIFYAFSGGILFYIGIYYLMIDMRRTDLKETILRSFLFVLTAGASWAVGFFY